MSELELDFDVSQPEPAGPPKKAPKAAPKKEVGKKKKAYGVFISWIIALVLFIIGVVICSINDGEYDQLITNAIFHPDPPIPFLEKLGDFMDPLPIFGWAEVLIDGTNDFQGWINNTWGEGDLGLLFVELMYIVFVILLIWVAGGYSSAKKKAVKEFREANPEWTQAYTKAAGEKNTAKLTELEKEKGSKWDFKMPENVKYWKYIWFYTLVVITGVITVEVFVKQIAGRLRPFELGDPSDFTPFWVLMPGSDHDSFYSGHTSQAAMLITIPFMFLGSKKKVIAYLLAAAAVLYTVLMGLGRMAEGDHWFSDVLFGGFVTYTIVVIYYYLILSVPYQEKTLRNKFIRGPFDRGYKLILEGKGLIKDDADLAFQKINKGLEWLAESKVQLEKAGEAGREQFGTLGLRIDDLTERFKSLIQEYFGLSEKSGAALDDYLIKWSYVF